MKKLIGKPLLYTPECINAEVKSNAAIGELNHNVNFKDGSTKTSLNSDCDSRQKRALVGLCEKRSTVILFFFFAEVASVEREVAASRKLLLIHDGPDGHSDELVQGPLNWASRASQSRTLLHACTCLFILRLPRPRA